MSTGDPDLPDAGEGMCCYGAAVYGPSRCTCWVPVYSEEQLPPQQGPQAVRPSMCGDCAFRKDSPERRGDDRYQHSGKDGIADLIANPGAVFACHDGMRRIVALVHPSGARLERPVDDYDPPRCGGWAAQASGDPALICAGFAAARGWKGGQDGRR